MTRSRIRSNAAFSPPERFLNANPWLVPFVKRKMPSLKGSARLLSSRSGNSLWIGSLISPIVRSRNSWSVIDPSACSKTFLKRFSDYSLIILTDGRVIIDHALDPYLIKHIPSSLKLCDLKLGIVSICRPHVEIFLLHSEPSYTAKTVRMCWEIVKIDRD